MYLCNILESSIIWKVLCSSWWSVSESNGCVINPGIVGAAGDESLTDPKVCSKCQAIQKLQIKQVYICSSFVWYYLGTYMNLKSVLMYQQVWSFLPLCYFLCDYVCYSYSKTLAYGKKTVFSQNIFNTHGFVCTRLYIRISFRKILISLLRHWFGRRQRLIMT